MHRKLVKEISGFFWQKASLHLQAVDHHTQASTFTFLWRPLPITIYWTVVYGRYTIAACKLLWATLSAAFRNISTA